MTSKASSTRVCAVTGESFEHTQDDVDFLETLSPQIAGTKYTLPAPTLSPRARHQRRLAWRNERFLYRSKCYVSGKEIVSAFSPDKPLKVCERQEWLNLDNRQFGREFDFSRPFFEQFSELYSQTIKANVIQSGEMVNSEYNQFVGWLKNCYLLFDSGKNEDCMYGVLLGHCRNTIDSYQCVDSELCYDSLKLTNCYKVLCSEFCSGCSFSAFLSDCIGCNHCICSVNLRNKSYYVFNQKVSKDEYQRVWQEITSGSWKTLEAYRSRFEEHRAQFPRRATNVVDVTDSSGDYLVSCHNVHQSFDMSEGKDCRYCYELWLDNQNCGDISGFGEGIEHSYELSGCGGIRGKVGVSNTLFSQYIFYGGYNVLYSAACQDNCKDLFGCSDLRRNEYCILNKQYSKDEYYDLVGRIIRHMQTTGEWGEFFPASLSPFGYNESRACEEIPLSKSEAIALGFNWSDYVTPAPSVDQSTVELPDSIDAVDASILRTAIRCQQSGKLFRIMKAELELYKKYKLPLPRLHPEIRQNLRFARRNKRMLQSCNCSACNKVISTTLDPMSVPKVLCQQCFTAELH